MSARLMIDGVTVAFARLQVHCLLGEFPPEDSEGVFGHVRTPAGSLSFVPALPGGFTLFIDDAANGG